jgi:hypothetical protein
MSFISLDREDSQEANARWRLSLAVGKTSGAHKRRVPLSTRCLFPVKHQNVFGLPFTGLADCHRQGF